MKIDDIRLITLKIPFKVGFKHASAERHETEAVVAIASAQDLSGYGEGCPRKYVTGETIETAHTFFAKHRAEILRIDSLPALRTWAAAKQAEIDRNPAAWCALETALLDLFAREEGKSLEDFLSLPQLSGKFYYTAVLGISKSAIFQAQLEKYAQIGFRQFKVKISGDLDQDKINLQLIRERSGEETDIRIDANNLWKNAKEASAYIKRLNIAFSGIEEPLTARDYAGLQEIAIETGCRIILDESFTFIKDLDSLPGNPEQWVPNIRISKMGGLLRSLDIAEACREKGHSFIIGAQVGETSILSRLALGLAKHYHDIVLGQEGAYGEYLLEKDIVSPCIMFGAKGAVSTHPFAEVPGLGLTPVKSL